MPPPRKLVHFDRNYRPITSIYFTFRSIFNSPFAQNGPRKKAAVTFSHAYVPAINRRRSTAHFETNIMKIGCVLRPKNSDCFQSFPNFAHALAKSTKICLGFWFLVMNYQIYCLFYRALPPNLNYTIFYQQKL